MFHSWEQRNIFSFDKTEQVLNQVWNVKCSVQNTKNKFNNFARKVSIQFTSFNLLV